ncbi:hypothetical protein CKO25_09115 [Thiocapsa imhoffii]|uniref:DUF4007 domain-containing protein n=1 Tax=Thiocapsa imhoffii TaxID=382777 RepID=A0A9X0WHT6_9GAMM|nr:DUF4007 family protein [Thiocapsa imhoffii]MBK1644805.1 hypothetical protein [Thiocapsa imhoffii]
MRINRARATFGRHETFPLRYGWLPKGFEAIGQDPEIFTKPEEAMITLGVGRNMVNAIQYWLQVTGLVTFDAGQAQPTALGTALLGAQADPYLEDDATLWILHWLIASNAEAATGFFWFFNRFAMPRFRDAEVLHALEEFSAQELKANRSLSTLKSDVSTLLRMYAAEPGRGDEHLDSPFAQFGLIEPDPGAGFRSLRTPRATLPPVALQFAIAQRLNAESGQATALPVRVLLYSDAGWAAPGAVFRLTEDGLMHGLARLIEQDPQRYVLRDTAGLHQLYLRGGPPDPVDILAAHYRGRTASTTLANRRTAA